MKNSINIKKIENLPLVSITVITYNSSKFVLETLESVKNQTYRKLELIISDDSSTDDTVEICQNWINENKERFVNTHLVTSTVNTGIPANKNRAIAHCNGEWLKSIAGDDLLLENCVEDNMNFITRHPESKIVISDMEVFYTGKPSHTTLTLNHIPILLNPKSVILQKKWLLLGYFGNSPSLFIKIDIFKKIKYDEKLKLIEDHPFSISAVNAGFAYSYLNKSTVLYRKHEDSVYTVSTKSKIYGDFYKTKQSFEKIYIYPEISKFEKFLREIDFFRYRVINMVGLNQNNFFCRAINSLTVRLSPYYTYKNIKFKMIIKENQSIKNNNFTIPKI